MKSKILTNSNKDVKEKNLDFYPLRRKTPCFRRGEESQVILIQNIEC